MLSYPGFLPLAPFPVNSLLKFCHHQVTSLPEDPQVDFFFSKESLFGIQKPLGSDHKGTHLPSLLHSAMIYPYQTPHSSPNLFLLLPDLALHMLFSAGNILCPLLSIHQANPSRSVGVPLVPTRLSLLPLC